MPGDVLQVDRLHVGPAGQAARDPDLAAHPALADAVAAGVADEQAEFLEKG